MSNDIQPIELNGRGLALRTLADMTRFAEGVIKAGLAPRSLETREKLIIAMQLGQEIGLSYMIALKSIAVINGTPTIYGDAALGLVRRSSLLVGINEEINGQIEESLDETLPGTAALCTVQRKNEEPITRAFTVGDARRAGLWNKRGPWQTHPKRMLQYKARAFALRDVFPDVLMGLHFFEEMVGEEPKQIESTDVSCKSQALLDGADNADQRTDLQEQPEAEPEPAGLPGEADGGRDAARTGAVGEGEPGGRDVLEHGSQADGDQPDAGSDAAKLYVCLNCWTRYDPEETQKKTVKGTVLWPCPKCASLDYDALADRLPLATETSE
jgi:DNA-directed RNA polymerase subunit RPC12/RpoP